MSQVSYLNLATSTDSHPLLLAPSTNIVELPILLADQTPVMQGGQDAGD